MKSIINNKGFTLIELLAVIVILSIIALIATPIILNIIGSTKNSAVVRSGELYLDAVELAIARENLKEQFNPLECIIQLDGNLTCDKNLIIIESTGSRPTSGTIQFNNGKILEVYEMKLDEHILKKESNDSLKILKRVEDSEPPKSYLMINEYTNSDDSIFLGGDIKRKDVESIKIMNTKNVPEEAIDSFDVSANQDKSIMAWYTDKDNNNLYELYIGQNGGVKANPNSNYLFLHFSNLKEIDLTNLDTSDTMYLLGLFESCKNLKSVDLSSLNLSKATNISFMFSRCRNLESANLNVSDASNVIYMQYMFQTCLKLTNIDLSSFNTSKVTDIKYMFKECSELETLNLSKIEFTNVSSYSGLFESVPLVNNINVKDENSKNFINSRLLEANKTGVNIIVSE